MKKAMRTTETKLNSDSVNNLKDENAKLQHELEMANAKIKWYEEQLRLGAAQKYGKNSDAVDEDQISFFNEAEVTARKELEEPSLEKVTYERTKKRGLNKRALKKSELFNALSQSRTENPLCSIIQMEHSGFF